MHPAQMVCCRSALASAEALSRPQATGPLSATARELLMCCPLSREARGLKTKVQWHVASQLSCRRPPVVLSSPSAARPTAGRPRAELASLNWGQGTLQPVLPRSNSKLVIGEANAAAGEQPLRGRKLQVRRQTLSGAQRCSTRGGAAHVPPQVSHVHAGTLHFGARALLARGPNRPPPQHDLIGRGSVPEHQDCAPPCWAGARRNRRAAPAPCRSRL